MNFLEARNSLFLDEELGFFKDSPTGKLTVNDLVSQWAGECRVKYVGDISDNPFLHSDEPSLLFNSGLRSKSTRRYDHLLSDISESLNRCMAYRREVYEIESAAVRSFLEYSSEINLNGIRQDLEILEWSNKVDVPRAEAVELIKLKYEKIRLHQQHIQSFHNTPGSVLNFQERRSRILRLFEEEFKDCYYKSKLFWISSRRYLPNMQPVPMTVDFHGHPKSDSILDDLIIWSRNTIDIYNKKNDNEDILNVFINLRDFTGEDGYRIALDGKDAETPPTRQLVFDINRYLKLITSGYTILSVGLSFDNDMMEKVFNATYGSEPPSNDPSPEKRLMDDREELVRKRRIEIGKDITTFGNLSGHLLLNRDSYIVNVPYIATTNPGRPPYMHDVDLEYQITSNENTMILLVSDVVRTPGSVFKVDSRSVKDIRLHLTLRGVFNTSLSTLSFDRGAAPENQEPNEF